MRRGCFVDRGAPVPGFHRSRRRLGGRYDNDSVCRAAESAAEIASRAITVTGVVSGFAPGAAVRDNGQGNVANRAGQLHLNLKPFVRERRAVHAEIVRVSTPIYPHSARWNGHSPRVVGDTESRPREYGQTPIANALVRPDGTKGQTPIAKVPAPTPK